MLSFSQAIILGLLQGATELFPISSLGHSVLLPPLLHTFFPHTWTIDESAPYFVILLVATHFTTALVLFFIFLKDWIRIMQGFFRTLLYRRIPVGDTYARLAWLLIVATIPTGLLGLLFQKKLTEFFASPHIVAVFLIGNGVLLLLAERLKRRRTRLEVAPAKADAAIARVGFLSAVGTGLMQSLALLPGFSRTGASITGGLLSGLDHESAARFSFLLATPIIFAAAILKLPALFTPDYPVAQIGAAALASAVAAFLSAAFLTRYFRKNTLSPFGWYCIIAGVLSLLVFLFQ